MKRIDESESLAEKLRLLYQTHDCENELPAHDNLVAKLRGVKLEVLNVIKMELNCDNVYPISYKEAEKLLDEAVKDEEMFQNLVEVVLEKIPDAEKKQVLEYLLGKTAEAAEKDAATKEFMGQYNNDARHVFKGFKANLKYFLKI